MHCFITSVVMNTVFLVQEKPIIRCEMQHVFSLLWIHTKIVVDKTSTELYRIGGKCTIKLFYASFYLVKLIVNVIKRKLRFQMLKNN